MRETQLLLGDCLERLKEMPDNSIDSIVTDPPYGLGKEPDAFAMLQDWLETGHHEVKGKGFMGKEWDAFVPQPRVWRECLRVLKPGGHLLAFAGTRTQDLMCLGLRLAGFEIRDMVAWVYGQGFPKSLNVGCKCGTNALPYTHEECLSREPKAKCSLHSLRDANVSTPVDSSKGRGQILQSGVSEQSAPLARRSEPSSAEIRQGQSGLEGWSNLLEEEGELQANQICQMPIGISADGEEGRIHYGASPSNGASDGEMLSKGRGGPSHQPRPTGQQTGELGIISKQQRTQESGGRACKKCGGIIGFEGFGTALKPSLEPITLARKPLEGTVAANVLKWHTGGLNIGGCRVDGVVTTNPLVRNVGGFQSNGLANQATPPASVVSQGRFPANLIHDGSDEVLELFPESKGQQGDLIGHSKNRKSPNGCFGAMAPASDHMARKDSGSSARFFYAAKCSKRDRNDGCDDLEDSFMAASNQAQAQLRRGITEHQGDSGTNSIKSAKNNHPTVKPTDLMRYLCRLITPPGGVILDPYMGSGSTGKAAMLEGNFNFTGIERDPDYFRIAETRINAAKAALAAKPTPQPDLFES